MTNSFKWENFLSGVLVTSVVHGVVFFLILLSVQIDKNTSKEDFSLAEQSLAAELVQLGEKLPEDELPNRVVPIAPTAPDDVEVASSQASGKKETKEEKPKESLEDKMKRLSDRSKFFNEIAEKRLLEGDPDGVEGGSSKANEGNIYRGQLVKFIKRGWRVPKTIPSEKLKNLMINTTVSFNDQMQAVNFQLKGTSGDLNFDESVREHLENLVKSGKSAPEPPAMEASFFRKASINVRFKGNKK